MANANQLWMQATDPYLVPTLPTGIFLNAAAPTPQVGDQWFDTTNLLLKMWDGNAWRLCGNQVARVKTQVDKTNTTLAGLTDLTFNLLAGKSYGFLFDLITTCDATGGWKMDLNGGTATATTVNASYLAMAAAASSAANKTALNSSAGAAAAALNIVISGVITVNAAGTFIPEFAQTAANATSSVLVGSTGSVWLIP